MKNLYKIALIAGMTLAMLPVQTVKAYDYIPLENNQIIYETPEEELKQIASEKYNGIYFLNDKSLSFYSLDSETYSPIFEFKDCLDAYCSENMLYSMYNSNGNIVVEIYNLDSREKVSEISVSGYTGTAVGADNSGRIYLSTYDGNESKILLLSAEGDIISECVNNSKVYEFSGFDSTNGNFYFESLYNYIILGGAYPTHSLGFGKVSDGVITTSNNWLQMLCQEYYDEHKDNAQLINDKYLMYVSYMESTVSMLDSNKFNHENYSESFIMALGRVAVENRPEGYQGYDLTSVGTRGVYNEKSDTFIIYNDGKVLSEYNSATGEIINTFTTKHTVFNLLQLGENLISIEKEGDDYFIEIITPEDMENGVIQIIQGDINGDGVLDIADLVELKKHLFSLSVIDDIKLADMDGDNKLTVFDASMLITKILK